MGLKRKGITSVHYNAGLQPANMFYAHLGRCPRLLYNRLSACMNNRISIENFPRQTDIQPEKIHIP